MLHWPQCLNRTIVWTRKINIRCVISSSLHLKTKRTKWKINLCFITKTTCYLIIPVSFVYISLWVWTKICILFKSVDPTLTLKFEMYDNAKEDGIKKYHTFRTHVVEIKTATLGIERSPVRIPSSGGGGRGWGRKSRNIHLISRCAKTC